MPTKSQGTSKLNNYYYNLNRVYNQQYVNFPPKQNTSSQNPPAWENVYDNTEEDADEKLKVDQLFKYVKLFKKNMASFTAAPPGGNITVTIADARHSIPCKKIALPNGDSIYVGVMEDRWVVSDGERYHIDDMVCPPAPWLDGMAYFLGHLAGVIQVYHAIRMPFAAARDTSPPKAALPSSSQRYDAHKRPFPLPAQVPDTPAPFIRPHLLFNIPSFLPGAYGATLNIAGPALPSPWHRVPKRHILAFAKPLSHDIYTSPSEYAEPQVQAEIPKKAEVEHQKEEAICETNVYISNHVARALYTVIKRQFIPLAKQKIYSLGWMIELNSFIYDKITEMYNDATYLNDRHQFVDIIMIKKNIEKKIEDCINSDIKNNAEEDLIKSYIQEQKTVVDFFPNFNLKLDEILQGVNFKTFRELIDLKNGISYDDAKKNLVQLINESAADMASIYKEQLYMLGIMQHAQQTYEKLLVSDSIPLIDRLIYFNTREIYLDMLDEHPMHLRRIILKRFFYYIFEYSRKNGLSMQGNYLIIPGELTEYRSLFDRPEPPLSEEEIAELVAHQIVDYIDGSDKYHPHIDRVTRDIEYFRINPITNLVGQSWVEISIQPYKETQNILDKSVEVNLARTENPYYQQNPQWMNELVDQIKYDKECVLLLSFLEKVQHYLIDIVSEHQHEQLILGSNSDEQRLAEAKLQATIMAFPGETRLMTKQDILTKYFNKVTTGDIELLLRAAIYWYMDYYQTSAEQLSELNSLFIIKQFQDAKKQISRDFETRSAENFKKIFELKCLRSLIHRVNFMTNLSIIRNTL
ncbi:hypothetical protein ABK905_02645 [Acerihabitans sp. KWT182]|uniref:Uncharacterized protein n=1 Tax=Acerihabitans sp. KWT182 TaxID=3157919 RepID=A0AAU7QAV6_9GAMM